MTDRETIDGKEMVDSTKPSERTRTGTPRKSKAKEIIVDEEFCVFCYGTCTCNDDGDFEELLRCSECLKYAHPSCLEMPFVAVERTKVYPWQCNDCKGCFNCKKKNKEKSMVLCDFCDRGFHTFCLEKKPTLSQRSSWKCPFCVESEGALGCNSPEKRQESNEMEQHKKLTKTQESKAQKQMSTKGLHEDRAGSQKKGNEIRKDRKGVHRIEKALEKEKGAKEEKKQMIEISDDERKCSVSEVKQIDAVNKRVDEGSEVTRKVTEMGDIEETKEKACKESKIMESKRTEENCKSVSNKHCKKKVSGKQNQNTICSEESGKAVFIEESQKDDSSKGSKKALPTKETAEDISNKDAIPKENESSDNQDLTVDKNISACEETKKESCFEMKVCSVALASNLDIKKIMENDKCQSNKVHSAGNGKKIDAETALKLDTETGEIDDIPDNKAHSPTSEEKTNLKFTSKQDDVAETNDDMHGCKEQSPARRNKRNPGLQKRRHSSRLGIRPVETLNDASKPDQAEDQTKDITVTVDKPGEEVKSREETSTVAKPGSISQRRRSSRFSLPVANIESGIKLKELEKVKEEIAALVGKKESNSGCDEKEDGNVQIVKRKRGRPRKVPLEADSSASDKEKQSEDEKNQNDSNEIVEVKEDTNKEPAESVSSDNEQETQRVLRKTSREPAITPTTARSILAAEAVQRIYPIRKTDPDKGTPLKKTPSKKQGKTPVKTPNRKSATKGTPKPATLKIPKSLTPKTPRSEKKSSASKKSETVKSESKSSITRKSDKTTDKKSATKSSSLKRRLSYDESSVDNKKSKKSSPEKPVVKIAKKDEPEASRTSKRQSKGKRRSEDVDTSKSPSDEELENVVSLADIAMFEQAQEMLKKEKEAAGENIVEQGIKKVDFGEYEIDTWYSSPYPSEYKTLGKVFVCEYCLKYMKSATILRRHMAKCLWRHPPGDEIYRKDTISVFEVDGAKSAAYCQNLCLFAKLFLDHKTLYYEVEPFLFYVMTVADCSGCHIVGYFSKEKTSFLNYNVSCILVLPHYMRKGYGKILIDFSYLLSRTEGKIGSPERPLSDLGLISYRSYWKEVLLRYLTALPDDHVSIKEMSQKTSVMSNDLISTMQFLGILKYWKGKHVITLQEEMLDAYATKRKAHGKLKLDVDEDCLEWTPKDYGQGKSRSKNS